MTNEIQRAVEQKTVEPMKFACPACGSDYIRGIDAGDYYDGEQGDCGTCGVGLAATCFVGKDGSESWALLANDGNDEQEPEINPVAVEWTRESGFVATVVNGVLLAVETEPSHLGKWTAVHPNGSRTFGATDSLGAAKAAALAAAGVTR